MAIVGDHVQAVQDISPVVPALSEGEVVGVQNNLIKVRITTVPPNCTPTLIVLPYLEEWKFVVGGNCQGPQH